MPQDHNLDRKVSRAGRARAMLLRAALAAALVGLVAGANVSAARAGDDDGTTDQSFLSKFMQSLGLKKSPDTPADIKYSERSPLVVPPTRDLPPPMAELPPAGDWPKDPDSKPRKHVKSKLPVAVPTANGQAAPAGGSAPAGQPAQAGVPNPPVQKTSIWNPKTWFSREEYATFASEPARDDLTDPPAGYRTPSPDQPYGLGPEKANTQPIGQNKSPVPAGGR